MIKKIIKLKDLHKSSKLKKMIVIGSVLYTATNIKQRQKKIKNLFK